MSDQFLYETLSPIIVIVLIAFLSAEFIGRSKHIGRGYTFFMMLGIIPGIIGLLFSPSAKNKPSQGNVFHTAFGVFLIIVLIVILYDLTGNFTYVNVFSAVSILASAIYCIQLSGGEVINNMPKYYFDTQDIQEVTIHKTKRNLDETISNLTDLKNKGILTEEEYQAKVEKVNQEQSEQDLKNSPEYKQLKSLLDSGILTKEEFEEKVKIIKKDLKERVVKELTEDSLIGTYKVGKDLFYFLPNNILEIRNSKNNKYLRSFKWEIKDMNNIHIQSESTSFSTILKNVEIKNNNIFYTNEDTSFVGINLNTER